MLRRRRGHRVGPRRRRPALRSSGVAADGKRRGDDQRDQHEAVAKGHRTFLRRRRNRTPSNRYTHGVATHLLVGNPAAQSGKNAERIEAAVRCLARAGVDAELLATQPAGATVGAVRDALERGSFDAVIAMGGDGTFREVAAGLFTSTRRDDTASRCCRPAPPTIRARASASRPRPRARGERRGDRRRPRDAARRRRLYHAPAPTRPPTTSSTRAAGA